MSEHSHEGDHPEHATCCISDEQLPEDLRPTDDNPLAQTAHDDADDAMSLTDTVDQPGV